MEKEIFNPMELDAIGEMMNISLGSSATAVSNMLEHRVDITTPKVTVVKVEDFELGNLEPAMGVQIKYVEGLDGSNIMLLKRSDVKVIVDILMGSQMPEEEFELNELTISAVCEVMNQMMGSAATAMSDFLGFPVNISTPDPFELTDMEEFKRTQFPEGAEEIVVVRFFLKIEDALESEFMNVISVPLAKELLKGLGLGAEEAEQEQPQQKEEPSTGDRKLSQEEIERMMKGSEADSQPTGDQKLSQEEIEQMMKGMPAEPPAPTASATPAVPAAPAPQMPPYGYPPMEGAGYGYMGYPPMYYPGYPYPPQAEPKKIEASPVQMQEMSAAVSLGKEQKENLDLIMEVPLEVTIEIGRTHRKVQDILEFTRGTLVVLDKLAGDQVDLLVNGKCVAKGDVVVVDDNFGLRITEIVQKNGMKEMLLKK